MDVSVITSQPHLPHANILIVDDTLENLLLLSELLDSQGYAVHEARNGEEALAIAAQVVPNLILLDVCMPGMDGYEVCRRLKASPTTADIPVIFISALDDVTSKVKAFAYGGVDYVTKPFQTIEVLARTRNHLLLQTALNTVTDLNHQLEQKVQERTHQLEQANAQLATLAYQDALTQLPNRTVLKERLAAALEDMQENPSYRFALLFLDCDRFKLINDSFGHAAGDTLLVKIAQRLSACLGPDHVLARFGGDEFVILTPPLTDSREAEAIARTLLDAFNSSFPLAERDIFITASIGIVLSHTSQHRNPEHMLRDADTAMYWAKNCGKARYSLFTPSMQHASANQLQIETELHQALQQQELLPFYQPIIDLEQGTMVGLEVLCRWQHPVRGLLLPGFFIPMAEETQLIIALENQLLDLCCAQLRRWQQQQLVNQDLYLSFNLSARHLSQADLPDQISRCLDRHQLSPHHLYLEITESSVLDNQAAGKILQQLRAQDIRLSIDDFGTGYSSLSYLHKLPVNTVKIDRSFIQGISKNSRDHAVVSSIVSIAETLSLDVVAEGIESPDQIYRLRQMGCKFGQGYLFSKPRSAEDMDLLLSQYNHRQSGRGNTLATKKMIYGSCLLT